MSDADPHDLDLSSEVGYLAPTKAALKQAMESIFGPHFPEEDFRKLLVSLEFPAKKEAYPSIWVDFDPSSRLETMGVDHKEIYQNEDGSVTQVRRWRFAGVGLFTIVALTSLERDRLFDHVVSHLAFGPRSDKGMALRAAIAENPYVAIVPQYDSISVRGADAVRGTPWETQDIIYEITVALEIEGEFATVDPTGEMAVLTAIELAAEIGQGGAPPGFR